jgi:hypothetical protein
MGSGQLQQTTTLADLGKIHLAAIVNQALLIGCGHKGTPAIPPVIQPQPAAKHRQPKKPTIIAMPQQPANGLVLCSAQR